MTWQATVLLCIYIFLLSLRNADAACVSLAGAVRSPTSDASPLRALGSPASHDQALFRSDTQLYIVESVSALSVAAVPVPSAMGRAVAVGGPSSDWQRVRDEKGGGGGGVERQKN